MSIRYRHKQGNQLGYWYADDPSRQDLEDLAYIGASHFRRSLFIVCGKPCKISPQWLAKHPMNVTKEGYDYCVSYSISPRTMGYMLDETETVEEAFNLYLEDEELDNCWLDIEHIALVDRRGTKREN